MRLLLVVLAALTLEGCQEADAATKRCREGRLGRLTGCDATSAAVSPATPYTFCSALSAGQRVGSWNCVNGDLTSPVGSTSTYSGVSVSANSGTSCASPPSQTMTSAAHSRVVADTALDTAPSTWTFCSSYKYTGSSNIGPLFWGIYPCCAAYAFTSEQAAVMSHYGTGGSINTLTTLSAGDRVLHCTIADGGGTFHSYIRKVGMSASYIAGTLATTSGAGYKHTFGAESAGYGTDGTWYGGFYTETALDNTALDNIFTSTVSCS